MRAETERWHPEKLPASPTTWGHSEKMAICGQRRGSSPDTKSAGVLILGLPTLQNYEK